MAEHRMHTFMVIGILLEGQELLQILFCNLSAIVQDRISLLTRKRSEQFNAPTVPVHFGELPYV